MQRRDILKTAGGIGAASTAGGAGLLALSGTAAASSSFTFTADNVHEKFGDGDVSEVAISPTGEVSWDNFDEEIVAIGITIKSRVRNMDGEQVKDWKTVHTTAATEEHGGVPTGKSGSHSGKVGPGNQVLYSGDETDDFDEATDGETNQVKVDVELTIELLSNVTGAGADAEWTDDDLADPADKAVLSDTATFVASATNKPASTSGSADANAEMS